MSLIPAIIKSYDKEKRTVKISVAGLSDGDKDLPEAELMYSMGDRFVDTEIKIMEGDLVWIDFMGGDERYPIVMGYRNPEHGNSFDWRRWKHKNIELNAEQELKLEAGADINATAAGAANYKSAGKATLKGGMVEIDGGGAMLGVVQGHCICPFTGAPHGHVSATVKASK
jgi:hypothetical protein